MPKIAAPLVNLCTVFLLFATTEQGSIYWIFIIRSVENLPVQASSSDIVAVWLWGI